jgi:hypothetical protein
MPGVGGISHRASIKRTQPPRKSSAQFGIESARNRFVVIFLAATASKLPPNLMPLFVVLGILLGIKMVVDLWIREKRRERRTTYYRDDYLKSDDWKRKRALVLKRDGYKCVFCQSRATQVHHKRYAPRNIGREPIDWLVAVCDACHRNQHN